MSSAVRIPTFPGRTVPALLLAACWSAAGAASAGADGPAPAAPKVDVTTYHNDLARTGLNPRETVLTPRLLRGEVAGRRFGKLWSVPVDGQVYAQPLILTDVPVAGGGPRDLAIVATEHNSVYALDAARPGPPVWHWSGITPDLAPVPSGRYESGKENLLRSYDIVPEVGITGTPVIDPASRRIYFVTKSRTREPAAPGADRYVQRLHCLDVRTGREIRAAVIAATYPGEGTGIDDAKQPDSEADRESLRLYAEDGGYDPDQGTNTGEHRTRFLPKCQNQRAGLLLLDGVVYVGWSSHGDSGAFHGWLIGFDAQTLDRVSAFNVTPSGNEGSIWQGGAAPAADDLGQIYLSTGNGSFNARGSLFGPDTDFGNCVLKISTRDRTLRVIDYFSPFNRKCLNSRDLDLGSGGVILLPKRPGDPRLLLVTAGKEGTIYLIDREHMGQEFLKDSDNVVRRLATVIGEKYGLGAYFDGSIYYGGGSIEGTDGKGPVPSPVHRLDLGKALEQSRPEFDASTHRRDGAPVVFRHKGTTPCLSANGTADAVLWTLRCDGGNEATRQEIEEEAAKGRFLPPAVLYAFDARTLELLWASDEAPDGTSRMGDRIKFTIPTIANGKVFVGTGRSIDGSHPGELNVFGVAE